ncbi:hypothetical protein THAOC_22453, partial [Thalassiosira oceanica]
GGRTAGGIESAEGGTGGPRRPLLPAESERGRDESDRGRRGGGPGASVHRKSALAFVGKALSDLHQTNFRALPQVAHSRRIQFRWAELARKKSDGTVRDDSRKALLSTRRNQESHYETPNPAQLKKWQQKLPLFVQVHTRGPLHYVG